MSNRIITIIITTPRTNEDKERGYVLVNVPESGKRAESIPAGILHPPIP